MSKNSYIIIGIIIIIVIVGATFFYGELGRRKAVAPTQPLSNVTQEAGEKSDGVTAASPVQDNVVTYSDSGYSPQILQVKAGATVTFKNESSESLWTASAIHPTHKVYPTTGGCLGSTFDECKGDDPGSSWQFKFDIPGTWKYHNHLNPSHTGTIVVE